jgi:K+-sensing histidine kinase KdpD
MSPKRLFIRPERSNLLSDLLLAVVAVAAAAGLRLLLTPVLYDRAAFVLFGLAVMITSWMGGRRVGLITTASATVAGMLLFVLPFTEATTRSWQNETLVVLFAVEGCGISFLAGQLHAQRSRARQEAQDAIRARNELEAALAQVQTLRGLIPICAWCKKIRNDNGYWEQLELYITKHSEADFTHGMCPDCARKHIEALQLSKDHSSVKTPSTETNTSEKSPAR